MQGKTQLFPGHESDFFRNRLTHSLEVAQIAESIARQLNTVDPYLADNPINPRICFTAALLHDIGHPPFGHNGEDALDAKMRRFGGFEGNAQTLRIVSQLEKKVIKSDDESAITRRCGLNLTYRQLAAVLKYDRCIPEVRDSRNGAVKGYYIEDSPVVDDIKNCISGNEHSGEFKTLECKIMDIADDIAYSTYDLEDSFKAGFLSPHKILTASADIFSNVAAKVEKETKSSFDERDAYNVFMNMFSSNVAAERYDETRSENISDAKLANAVAMIADINVIAEDSRIRTNFTSELVGSFVDAVTFELNPKFPALSDVGVALPVKQKIEALKRFSYEATIRSSRLRLAEYRGHQIVSEIFDALAADGGDALLPDDQLELWKCGENEQQKMRVISDFIAGMTDRYALEFYGRLFSDSPVSMFKTA